MENVSVRLIRPPERARFSLPLLLVILFFLPTIAPLATGSGDARIESRDFAILDELEQVLEMKEQVISGDSVSSVAGPLLDQVRVGVQGTSVADPLHDIDEALDEVSMVETAPPSVIHPEPYIILTDEDSRPPGEVRTIWSTLFNLTDYVIWTRYVDVDGNVVEQAESITFLTSLLSLLDPETEFLLHQLDVDDDGDDDIQVGLTVNLNDIELSGTTLSAAVQLDYRVSVLDSSTTDTDWDNLRTLEVSILKAFAYSDGVLNEGESYVWVIDSKFTHTPYDFTLGVGLERINFDIGNAGSELVLSIVNALTFGVFNGGDESGVSIASISSPYQISIDNSGQTNCPDSYSPIELTSLPSSEISCGVTAGFGYIHYSPPDSQEDRDVWEVAYIEAAIHPNRLATILPQFVDVTIRTDSTLADGTGNLGENGLDERLASKILIKSKAETDTKPSIEKMRAMDLMKKIIPFKGEINLKTEGPKIVAFVGPTGVGKTTTIAKVAADYVIRKNKKVALVSLDTYRLGAVDQLEVYGDIMRLPVEVAEGSEELREIVKRHSDKDLILIDTTGRSHRDKDYSRQLKEIFDVVGGVETHLVLSVTAQEKQFTSTYQQFLPIGVDRVLFTKLDEGLSFGSVFNFSVRNRIPLSYFTMGQNVPEDLEIAVPDKVISLIFN